MGFSIDYLEDGTIKASLNLKEEDIDVRCIRIEKQPTVAPETASSSVIKNVAEIKSSSKQVSDKAAA
jgi:hypothetical protein